MLIIKNSMTKAGHMIEIDVIIGIIRISEVGTTFRDDRNRGKYDNGDRRDFEDRDRSHDRGRSRDRDNK